MNKVTLASLCLLFHFSLFAQKTRSQAIHVPMTAEKWGFPSGTCEFLSYRSAPAMHLLSSKDTAVLKDLRFSNGTIEYDIDPQDNDFTGVFFRRQDSKESEYFYLRVFGGKIPGMMVAVQYAPILHGVNLWNLLPYCQGPASFARGQWNHIKLVISGEQMLVYVNDPVHPTLEIAHLEGVTKEGSIGFDGKAIIANLVVTPDATEGLSPVAGFDPYYSDPRYVRHWSVSQPIDLPRGRELTREDLPKAGAAWSRIEAERLGLVNLTRMFGNSASRRYVWLKCRLKAPEAQVRQVAFGFTNEVWVFVNGKMAFVDKNIYDELMRKQPKARCSIENNTFTLPLQAGDNEILIGVANNFYGWAIITRLDSMEGIEALAE
ncbi:MAG TPA: hypothetical protein VHD83_08245 [Puia sp.]|nr:hypothetical protein [Puia sp.]